MSTNDKVTAEENNDPRKAVNYATNFLRPASSAV